MRWSAAGLAWLALASWLGGCGSSQGSDAAAAQDRPVALLILHGGGFVFEDKQRLRVARRMAAEAGFDPVYIDYRLFDMRAAIGAAQDAARKLDDEGRKVVAYGESVGGTMAALLAKDGLVDAAATYSPVADMRAFASHNANPPYYRALIGADSADLRDASPVIHDSQVPILAMVAGADEPYMAHDVRLWARHDASVEVNPVPGRHIGTGQPGIYAENVAAALDWLQR